MHLIIALQNIYYVSSNNNIIEVIIRSSIKWFATVTRMTKSRYVDVQLRIIWDPGECAAVID